jgi:selenocysteine-specific elongation factor
MPREEARVAAGIGEPKLFAALLDASGDVTEEGTLVRLASHRVTLSPEDQAARAELVRALDEAGYAPPPLADLAAKHGARLVEALIEAGDLVKISRDLALSRGRYDQAKGSIAASIRADGPAPASRIRDVLGTSRKYLIPLLEHLDAAGFTKRSGDLRTLAADRDGDVG